MSAVNAVALKTFNLAALFQFTNKLIELIRKEGAEKLRILSEFNNLLLPAFAKLDEAYNKGKASVFTATIKKLDDSRDEIIKIILGIIKLMLKDIDADNREAARILKLVFDRYKGITKKHLNEESAGIINLLQVLKGEHAQLIEKLGLKKYVDELERINKEIDSQIDERILEKADKSKKDGEQAKKATIAAIRPIFKLLDVYYLTNPAAFEEFIRNLNALISEFGGKRSGAPTGGSDNSTSENGSTEPYPNAREWSADIDYQTCASGDIFYIVRNGVKEYYKLLDFGEVATFEPGMDDGGIWEKL